MGECQRPSHARIVQWHRVVAEGGRRIFDIYALYEKRDFYGVIGWVRLSGQPTLSVQALTPSGWRTAQAPNLKEAMAWVQTAAEVSGALSDDDDDSCRMPDLYIDSACVQWTSNLDWKCQDLAYWRAIFQRVRAEVIPSILVDVLCTSIRRRRYDWRRDASTWQWERVYDAQTVLWLTRTIAAAQHAKGDPCNDNPRAADWSKRSHRKHYEALRAQGCCGFHDEFVTAPDGRQFRIGFNYGH